MLHDYEAIFATLVFKNKLVLLVVRPVFEALPQNGFKLFSVNRKMQFVVIAIGISLKYFLNWVDFSCTFSTEFDLPQNKVTKNRLLGMKLHNSVQNPDMKQYMISSLIFIPT
jgi:hypothetical protein